MPRKRKEVSKEATGTLQKYELPPLEEFQPTTKATRGKLLRLQERVLLKNAEGALEESFQALRNRVRRHDLRAIQTVFEVYSLVKGGRGTTINNNLIQSNNNRADAQSESTSRVSFESLARKLDARDSAVRESQTIEAQAS